MKLNITFKLSRKMGIALNNKLQNGGHPSLRGHLPSVEGYTFLEHKYSTINIWSPVVYNRLFFIFSVGPHAVNHLFLD